MGQLIKFPEGHDEQICLTPGLGAHTEDGRVVGKSTNMANFSIRLFTGQKPIPDSTYFMNVDSLTAAGQLLMSIMDKMGKKVYQMTLLMY